MRKHRYRRGNIYGNVNAVFTVVAFMSGIMVMSVIGYYYRDNINALVKNGLVNAAMEQCMSWKYSDKNENAKNKYFADMENAGEEENIKEENGEEQKDVSLMDNAENETKESDTANQEEKESETVAGGGQNGSGENPQPAQEQQGSEPVCKVDVSALSFNYLMSNYYTVASTTKVYEDELNAERLMSYDMTMKQDNSAPQILIYHTHGQEAFADSGADSSRTIVAVGEYLSQVLREKYGYNVIHVTDSFDLINGVLDRSKAYDYAYNRISKVLEENPSVEVVIDLHRDGIDESRHLVTNINGKPTAQIMFFNGMSRLASAGDIGYLYNPNREMNLAMSMQMKVKAMEYYPDFTRRNYLQAYEYNLQLRPKAMLIEAGAQTNTFEEELNAMEVLADIMNKVLG